MARCVDIGLSVARSVDFDLSVARWIDFDVVVVGRFVDIGFLSLDRLVLDFVSLDRLISPFLSLILVSVVDVSVARSFFMRLDTLSVDHS